MEIKKRIVVSFHPEPEPDNIVAWAYMVDAESGVTPEHVKSLISRISSDVEIITFNTLNTSDANSIAYGFILNDNYDDMDEIIETVTSVCDNWENENSDCIYTTSSGLKIYLTSDFETIIVE